MGEVLAMEHLYDRLDGNLLSIAIGRVMFGVEYQIAPPYHEDSNYVKQVVTEMSKRGYSFGVWYTSTVSSVMRGWCAAFVPDVYPPIPPQCEIDGYIERGQITYGYGETHATAICRAALKALDRAQHG